jgi:hypothetical protein
MTARTFLVAFSDGSTLTTLDASGTFPERYMRDIASDVARERGAEVTAFVVADVPDDQVEASRDAALRAIADTARPTGG